jgi:uncharacterized protein YndB with AHSA1/START domain
MSLKSGVGVRGEAMVTVKNTVTINRPPEAVFAFVTEPSNEPKWHTDVLEARRTSDGPMGVGATVEFLVNVMGRKKIALVVREYDPPRRMVVEATSQGSLMPSFTFIFEPVDGGTRFNRQGDIRTGGLLKLLEPLMRRTSPRRIDGFLANLKQMLEAPPT